MEEAISGVEVQLDERVPRLRRDVAGVELREEPDFSAGEHPGYGATPSRSVSGNQLYWDLPADVPPGDYAPGLQAADLLPNVLRCAGAATCEAERSGAVTTEALLTVQ